MIAKLFGMYGGGAALGAGAGATMNLMAGDQEEFIGSTVRGGMMGLAGGAAVRSLTTRGGYLSDFGLAIGRTLDDTATVSRAERLEKLNTKLKTAKEDDVAGIQEQITKLETQEGGGITRFFQGLTEEVTDREARISKEYGSLINKKKLTESENMRLEKIQSEYDPRAIMETRQVPGKKEVDEMGYHIETTVKDPISGDTHIGENIIAQDKFQEYLNTLNDPTKLTLPPEMNMVFNKGQADSLTYQPLSNLDPDQIKNINPMVIGRKTVDDPGNPVTKSVVAGYTMHQKGAAQNSISARNKGMIVAGAGLTGAMVGYSHSSGRKSKRRGFNSNRGSRF